MTKKPRRHRREKTKKQQLLLPQQDLQRSKKLTSRMGLSRIAGGIAFGSTLIGYFVLLPDISISPMASRDPKQPFESHFFISNNSPFSLYGLSYICEETDLAGPNWKYRDIIRPMADIKTEIFAKSNYSLYCGAYINGYIQPTPPDDIAYALTSGRLNIYLHFTLSFWPFEIIKGFGFELRRDREGNALWLPQGGPIPKFGKPL